jgi:hypothetical protein
MHASSVAWTERDRSAVSRFGLGSTFLVQRFPIDAFVDLGV